MHAKRAMFSSALLFALIVSVEAQPGNSAIEFTLQVASFPESAQATAFAERLARAGEPVGFGLIELPGKGRWTRVYVGSFRTTADAREYGDLLIKRNLIAEYLVKTARDVQELGRPRSVKKGAAIRRPANFGGQNVTVEAVDRPAGYAPSQPSPALALPPAPRTGRHDGDGNGTAPSYIPQIRSASLAAPPKVKARLTTQPALARYNTVYNTVALPAAARARWQFAPGLDINAVPQPDPVSLAFSFINQRSELIGGQRDRRGDPDKTPDKTDDRAQGGLWASGDLTEALERLRWIVGGEARKLIGIDPDGRVHIDRTELAALAGISFVEPAEAPVRVARYITENEGLLLLVQISQDRHRYLLHVGSQPPTLGGVVEVAGSANLDNNYDSRINPYRRNGEKLGIERPPSGFDALVALNPSARWYNLRTREFVPVGHITFHELAEAHAKIVLRVDYLETGRIPGAHEIALEREERLKNQRPLANVVLTLGSNRLFKSEEEIRQFHQQSANALGRR